MLFHVNILSILTSKKDYCSEAIEDKVNNYLRGIGKGTLSG